MNCRVGLECPTCKEQQRPLGSSSVWTTGTHDGVEYYVCNYGHEIHINARTRKIIYATSPLRQ